MINMQPAKCRILACLASTVVFLGLQKGVDNCAHFAVVQDLDGDGKPEMVVAVSALKDDSSASVGLILFSPSKDRRIRIIDGEVELSSSGAPLTVVEGGDSGHPYVLYVGRVGEQAYLITASLTTGKERGRVALGQPGSKVGWGGGGPSLWPLGPIDKDSGDEILLRHASVGAEEYFKAQVVSPITGKVLRTRAGTFIGPVGDVDKDGVRDYVVSQMNDHSVESGRTGKVLQVIADSGKGEDGDAWATEEFFPCGDCDGDNVVDIIQLISWSEDEPARQGESRLSCRIVSGRTGLPLMDLGEDVVDYKVEGSACTVGDQNGDGVADVLISWIDFFRVTGGFRLFSAANGELLSQQLWHSGNVGDGKDVHEYSRGSMEDLVKDGLSDIALSQREWKEYANSSECLFLLSRK